MMDSHPMWRREGEGREQGREGGGAETGLSTWPCDLACNNLL